MMVEMKDTSDKVISIIAQKLNVELSAINEESTLQDFGADSLNMVDIIMTIEENLGVEINDEEADKLANVGEFIAYIHRLRTKDQ